MTRARALPAPARSGALLLPVLAAVVASVPVFFGAGYAQAPSGPQPPTAISAVDANGGMQALVRARDSVEKFFERSANVVCAESVTQMIIAPNGKASYREESKYDYQLEASNANGSLKLVESREARKLPFRDPARTLLVTNGFASLLLIVHPQFETSYQFQPAGEEVIDGMTLEEIRFTAIPGGSSPAALRLRGKNYPLPLSGTIWIEKDTGAITRMTAAVDSSLSDLGLKSMSSDIHYALVRFHDPEEAYWMPVSATVDLETPLQHWRNVHRFTAYRRFRATIQIEMGKGQ